MIIDNYKIRWRYPKAKGAQRTVCVIETGNVPVSIAEARCMKTDEFNKEFGRKCTLARALKNADFSKEYRAKIWDTYRTMTATPRWQKK